MVSAFMIGELTMMIMIVMLTTVILDTFMMTIEFSYFGTFVLDNGLNRHVHFRTHVVEDDEIDLAPLCIPESDSVSLSFKWTMYQLEISAFVHFFPGLGLLHLTFRIKSTFSIIAI